MIRIGKLLPNTYELQAIPGDVIAIREEPTTRPECYRVALAIHDAGVAQRAEHIAHAGWFKTQPQVVIATRELSSAGQTRNTPRKGVD